MNILNLPPRHGLYVVYSRGEFCLNKDAEVREAVKGYWCGGLVAHSTPTLVRDMYFFFDTKGAARTALGRVRKIAGVKARLEP